MGNKLIQGDININGTLQINGQPLPEMTALTDAEIEILLSLPPIDPILANNSWHTIRLVCEAGLAQKYWNLGDAKTVTTNSLTREFRIADMSGLYGKHVVFASWTGSEQTGAFASNNVNDYSVASPLLTDLAVGGKYYAEFVDAELAAELTDTTVKVAQNGNSSTLVNATGKLFIPAEKEITATRVYSVQAEFDALTTYAYFLANDNDAFRIRHKASDPTGTSGIVWWTRSPRLNQTNIVVSMNAVGRIGSSYANDTGIFAAPCFSF